MKVLRQVTQKTKQMEEAMFFKEERVTVINERKIIIQNYRDLLSISETEVVLSNLRIVGEDLRIKTISKFIMEIEGKIHHLSFGGVNHG